MSDQDVSPKITPVEAPFHVRMAIHSIIVGQMAAAMLLHKADLYDRAACRTLLLVVGHGESSVDQLLSRAIDLARKQSTPPEA